MTRHLAFESLEPRQMLDGAAGSEASDAPMPDFDLVDVNSTSASHGQTVSPRDHLGEVSAWYFGHAT
jgi:hypothetical protein